MVLEPQLPEEPKSPWPWTYQAGVADMMQERTRQDNPMSSRASYGPTSANGDCLYDSFSKFTGTSSRQIR